MPFKPENCQDILAQLPDYLEGSTDSGRSETIRQHLQCCGDCRSLVEELQTISAGLAKLPLAAPPASLREKIRQRAFAEGLLHSARKPAWNNLPVWLAAALILCVTGLTWFYRTFPDPPLSPEAQIMADLREAKDLYHSAARRLEECSMAKAAGMEPATKRIFEENLALVNSALRHSEAMLKTNEADPRAWGFLLTAYQKKIDFLQLFLRPDIR